MKLALGTVQFGLDYGISNADGKVSPTEIDAILQWAQAHHIDTLDCAATYGSSEQVLGETKLSQNFSIISKTPSLENVSISIAKQLSQSLSKLKRDNIDGLLLHNCDDLISTQKAQETYQQLKRLKTQGLVNKIGVSVYTTEQLIQIINNFDIDLVQLPINCFDQRFLKPGLLEELVQKNIEVHCRSAFLQGLLLMDNKSVPDYFADYQKYFQNFEALAQQLNCSKLTLALSIVAQNPLIERIVIGCCNKKQLEEIIQSYQMAQHLDLSTINFQSLACSEPALINPSLWSLND